MRSSKSRSRNKNNRNNNRNSLANVVNRVFDSNGPEGKVRGTPQQIIDKYNQLARDAALGNDRVATENFQQHAEHYLRLLSEAQKEQDARREQQDRENRERQAQRDRERSERDKPQGDQPQDKQPEQAEQPQQQQSKRAERDLSEAPQPDVMDFGGDEESGLVETPESRSETQPEAKPKKPRAPRKPKAETTADAPKAEEGEKPKRPRAPRKPKPKPEETSGGDAEAPKDTSQDAAE